jgi:thiol peroxidase
MMGKTPERKTQMEERKGLVTFKGEPLTLLGPQLTPGSEAPDFTAIANDLSEKTLADFKGKVLLLVAVPSLDTSVCDTEARRFNEEAAKLGDDAQVLVLSMDLPFAQKRWCGNAGIENVVTLSDHRDASFGRNYGMLIKELRLLARSVWVVDKEGKIRYIELINEMTNEPDYDAALAAAKAQLS